MNWHRLFGLLLTDFFTGSPCEVELEKDLSKKKQILDVVILRKRQGQFAGRLPDGFDALAPITCSRSMRTRPGRSAP
jgi:hypothetical protein